MARLCTCQPFMRKTRCTVCLLNPNSQATVLYPNEGSSSIMALIGSAKRGSTLAADFVGL